jgi:hypothetical protein
LGTAREDFLRRYATSPIHVPRLERLLAAYGDDEEGDDFAVRFIGWDRACPNAEAARIVSEIMSVCVDESGRIIRLADEVVHGAIVWLAGEGSSTMPARAAILKDTLTSGNLERIEYLVGDERSSNRV